MKRTIYTLNRSTAEIIDRHLDRAMADVRPGCTVDLNETPEHIARFDSLDAALDALNKHEMFIDGRMCPTGHLVMVEEYTVEECVFDVDEDGDEDFVELVNIYTCDRAPESVRIFSRSFNWIDRGAYSGYEEQESEE